VIPDKSARLQRLRGLGHGRPSHARHESQEVVRERKFIAPHTIMSLQQPAGATARKGVMVVAGGALRDLCQKRLCL
jgi:hypothetical protein